MEIVLELAFHAAVQICRVPHHVSALLLEVTVRGEHVVVQQLVSDTGVDGRYDGVVCPRLELDEHFVLEFHDSQGVSGFQRIQIELSVVQVPCVRVISTDFVLVYLAVCGVFA